MLITFIKDSPIIMTQIVSTTFNYNITVRKVNQDIEF